MFGSSGAVGTHDESLTTKPAIVIGRKGNAGSVHIAKKPCWPIDTAFYAEVPDHLDAEFWFYRLKFEQLGKLDQSTAIPSLSRDRYSPIIVAVPPLDEQARIVSRINELFSDIEAGERAVERARAALSRYRKAVPQSRRHRRAHRRLARRQFPHRDRPSPPHSHPPSPLRRLGKSRTRKARRQGQGATEDGEAVGEISGAIQAS